MSWLTTDQLAIYLADHHAGATFGLELARRARDRHRGTPCGEFLAVLADELEENRAALERFMRGLEIDTDPVKDAAAWTGEKLGRLKLNGRLISPAPLSSVIELEGLIAGVSGQLALWNALKQIAPRERRLDEDRLDELADRARRQLARLRDWHRRTAEEAFR
jgi:hypothetical protein